MTLSVLEEIRHRIVSTVRGVALFLIDIARSFSETG